MGERRCDLTDLPQSMCAHCLGHQEHPKAYATGPTIEARMNGSCACGCTKRIAAGDSITYSGDAAGWCLTEHTREA